MGGVARGIGPEFKPQHYQKKKKSPNFSKIKIWPTFTAVFVEFQEDVKV
jgi:hypothetical protein